MELYHTCCCCCTSPFALTAVCTVCPTELMVMADRMNEQHRASKAAQKECMELYLLLLLHSRPHVESGLLVGVQVWVLGASGAPGLNGFMQHCLKLLLSVPFSGPLLAMPKSHRGRVGYE